MQILIGIFIGLILYFIGIIKHDKNKSWANFTIGGGLFIEFLTISFGIFGYKVIPDIIGFIILLTFILISMFFTLKFKSRIIGYYFIIGGFLIPILTGIFNSYSVLSLLYLTLFLLSILVLSIKENWYDIRFASFIFESLYLTYYSFSKLSISVKLSFLFLNFLIFNISSIIFSIKNKKELNVLDILILNINSFLFIILLFGILSEIIKSNIGWGLILLIFAFFYLIEIFIIKTKASKNNSFNILYESLFASGLISLNTSIFLIFTEFDISFLIVPFIIQWFLFRFISKKSAHKNFYKFTSYVFLTLVIFWYLFTVRFDKGIGIATFYLFVYLTIPILFYILNKYNINKTYTGAGVIISTYLIIFSFYKYLLFFINQILGEVILSIMWLIHNLVLLKLVSYNEKAKTLMYVLLGITLLKITIVDLNYLSGFYKIIGFIIFGIILLIGGYFIKNEINK